MSKKMPSFEDVLELSGIEVLHPGGLELSARIAEVVDMENKNVLDVSCGRGVFACYYAKSFGARVTGLDIDPEMIGSSVKRAKQEEVENSTGFVVGDSLALPFPENSYDLVVNECAVGLTGDPQKCLDEAVRVTKPGGYIIIHESLWLKELPEDEKSDVAKRLGTVPFKLSEWKEMFKHAGAIDIRDEDWSDLEKMRKMRPDKNLKNIGDVFSIREKISIIIPRVLKRYGIRGFLYLNESSRKITPLYYNGILGYCLIKGQKPERKVN